MHLPWTASAAGVVCSRAGCPRVLFRAVRAGQARGPEQGAGPCSLVGSGLDRLDLRQSTLMSAQDEIA